MRAKVVVVLPLKSWWSRGSQWSRLSSTLWSWRPVEKCVTILISISIQVTSSIYGSNTQAGHIHDADHTLESLDSYHCWIINIIYSSASWPNSKQWITHEPLTWYWCTSLNQVDEESCLSRLFQSALMRVSWRMQFTHAYQTWCDELEKAERHMWRPLIFARQAIYCP